VVKPVPREREYRKEPRLAIDLNFDGGEGYDDLGLMRQASTVNIACGAHAGDPQTMLRTVRLALRFSTAINAHPGYPDRENFGRARMSLSPEETENAVYSQVATLYEIARSEEVLLAGVKPHGGLYHAAVADAEIAMAVARAVLRVSRELVVVGAPRSKLLEAAQKLGLVGASEGFADRSYRADGSLVPRSEPGAVIEDPAKAAKQAVALAREGCVTSRDGTILRVKVDTLCVHGDTPAAPAIAAEVRKALLAEKVVIRSLKGWVADTRPDTAPGGVFH
jgi:UPF0271 protein